MVERTIVRCRTIHSGWFLARRPLLRGLYHTQRLYHGSILGHLWDDQRRCGSLLQRYSVQFKHINQPQIYSLVFLEDGIGRTGTLICIIYIAAYCRRRHWPPRWRPGRRIRSLKPNCSKTNDNLSRKSQCVVFNFAGCPTAPPPRR